MTRVLIISHADADGHLIAEQARRNLSSIPAFEISVVVDPTRTQGHQAWRRLETFEEVNDADVVFFLDLMFSPAGFVDQANDLRRFAKKHADKTFYVVDHHPLPLKRLYSAPNIRPLYRPDVFDCVFGPRSGMMVVAAICEHQRSEVADMRQPHHDVIAKGVRRAAAPGGQLAGPLLLAMLKADRWDLLYALGSDDNAYHRLVRGRRVAGEHKSDLLVEVEKIAEALEKNLVNEGVPMSSGTGAGSREMPYDLGVERFPRSNGGHGGGNEPTAAKDLESLVTVLEVAALTLTSEPDATFTTDELIAEARDIAGEGLLIDDRDVRIILEKATFLEQTRGRLRLR